MGGRGTRAVAVGQLVADVYASGRGELAWDALAARMARLSGAEALWILRGDTLVARHGSGDPPKMPGPECRSDSQPSRIGAEPARLVQRFSAPTIATGVLDPLLSHLARVLDLADRDRRLSGLGQTLAHTLVEHVPVAMFEIETDFRVRHANAPAQTLAREGTRLWIRHGVLGFRAEGTRSQLRQRMQEGATQVVRLVDDADDAGLALCLHRRDEEAWWLAALDPSHPPKPSLAELQRRYGLSAREGRLALEIACGASLAASAERLGVSQGTVRSQLKAVFRKTSTRSQAELVIRLRDEPAWLLMPDPKEMTVDRSDAR